MGHTACIGTLLVLCLIKQIESSDNIKDFVDELVYRSCPGDVSQLSLCTLSGLRTHTHTETQSFATLKPTSLEENFSLLTAYDCLCQLVTM